MEEIRWVTAEKEQRKDFYQSMMVFFKIDPNGKVTGQNLAACVMKFPKCARKLSTCACSCVYTSNQYDWVYFTRRKKANTTCWQSKLDVFLELQLILQKVEKQKKYISATYQPLKITLRERQPRQKCTKQLCSRTISKLEVKHLIIVY